MVRKEDDFLLYRCVAGTVLGAPGGGWEMPGMRCHSKGSSPGGVWVCGPGLGRSGQIRGLRQGYRRLELLSR